MANAREKQAKRNAESIIGEYINGIYDGYEEPFKSMDELIAYVYPQMFDIMNMGGGRERFQKGICDDLKFLGEDRIKEIIASVEDCGECIAEDEEEEEIEIEVGGLETEVIQKFTVKYNGDSFIVEIRIEDNTFSAYLQKVGYGIKSSLFGLPVGQNGINTFEDAKRLIVANLQSESYLEDYNEEYGF